MSITELGHTGLWVFDLTEMRRFYTTMLDLQVTDEDADLGIVFLSARPDAQHHELVLQHGRTAEPGALLTHQISWQVDSLATLREFHFRFQAAGVQVQQEVTHGNAFGIYFFDPEGNRNEVFLPVERDVRQPFRKTLNLELPDDELLAEAEALLRSDGPAYNPVS